MSDSATTLTRPGRRRLFGLVRVFALMLAAGLMTGCGGDDESSDEKKDESKAQAKAPLPGNPASGDGQVAPDPGAGGPPGGGAGFPGGPGDPSGAGGGESGFAAQAALPPAEPPRSNDYSVWSEADFKNAVRERDQAVVGAIAWLGDNKQDDDSAELLVELLAISLEPAKQPPVQQFNNGGGGGGNFNPGGPPGFDPSSGGAPFGPSGSGGQEAPGPGGAGGGGGGAGSMQGSLDDAAVRQVLFAALSGDMNQLLFTSVVTQQGPPGGQGYPGAGGGPPGGEGYPGAGQNGPPGGEGYPGAGQNGPPGGEGYPGAGGPPGGEGYPGAGGPPGGEGYPGAGGPPGGQGYPGAGGPPGGGGQGYPGAGGPPGGGAPFGPTGSGGQQAPAFGGAGGGSGFGGNQASYAHYGTLKMNDFVTTTVESFLKIDSPKSWDAISKLLDGAMKTPMDADRTSELVLSSLIANYGGPDHPTHTLLTGLLSGNSPQSEKAVALYTDYAASALDQILGVTVGGAVANNNGFGGQFPGGPGNPSFGGGPPPGPGIGPQAGGGGPPPGPGVGPQAGGGGSGGLSDGGGGLSDGGGFNGGGGGGGLSDGGGGLSDGGGGLSEGGGGFGPPGGGFGPPGGNAPPAGPPVESLAMSAQPRKLTPEELQRITNLLWSPDFTQAVGGRLSQNTGLHDSPQLLALASCLPTPSMRQTQYDLFAAHKATGPASLKAAGFFDRIARDPALLVLLKSMPSGKRSPGSNQSQWDESVRATALALRDRLKRAALTRGGVMIPMVPPPVRLHKDAKPVSVYHAKWPQGVSGVGSTGPGSTEILYVRMQVEGDDRKLGAVRRHYQQRIGSNKKIDAALQQDQRLQMVWDSSVRQMKTGMKRSIDVFYSKDSSGGGGFSAGGGLGGPGAGGGSKAVIEIVVVDAPNPNVQVSAK